MRLPISAAALAVRGMGLRTASEGDTRTGTATARPCGSRTGTSSLSEDPDPPDRGNMVPRLPVVT